MYNYKHKETNINKEVNYLLSKTLTMFRYKNLPETIPQRELERQLQNSGYAFITKVQGKYYSFVGGLGGEPDVYGNPTTITIANPALDYNETLDIEKDGVLIRNDTMMNGLKYLLEKYIFMMNESETTMIINGYNSRMPFLIAAGDDNTKASAEAYIDKIIKGEIGVVAENQLFEGLKVHNGSSGVNTYTQFIEYQQYLKATLYNELGLEMNNNMKRERLTQDEVNMTDIVYPFVDNMLTNRQKSLEDVNAMYDLNIEVGFDSVWAKHAPSDAWDTEEFYAELDSYLDMLQGPTQEEQPQEETEDSFFPDMTDEEILSIIEQLEQLSEEVDNEPDNDGGKTSGDWDSSDAEVRGEQREAESSDRDSGSSGSNRTDDSESGDNISESSDGTDADVSGQDTSGHSGPDTGNDESGTGGTLQHSSGGESGGGRTSGGSDTIGLDNKRDSGAERVGDTGVDIRIRHTVDSDNTTSTEAGTTKSTIEIETTITEGETLDVEINEREEEDLGIDERETESVVRDSDGSDLQASVLVEETEENKEEE